MSHFSNLAIDEQNKIKENNMSLDTDIKMRDKLFCEKCEEWYDEDKFTMDEDGEVCDSCCQDYGDRQYEAWKEREAERKMEEAEKEKK